MLRKILIISLMLLTTASYAQEIVSEQEKLSFVATVVKSVLRVTNSSFILKEDSLTLHSSNGPGAAMSWVLDLVGFAINQYSNSSDLEYAQFTLVDSENIERQGFLYVRSEYKSARSDNFTKGLTRDGFVMSEELGTYGCIAGRDIIEGDKPGQLRVSSKDTFSESYTHCPHDIEWVLNLE